MKTGIELIARERKEQLSKHGFDAAHDDSHTAFQLHMAAVYLLTENPQFFPFSWDVSWKEKFDQKNRIDRLAVAGALIAAEIDRLQRHNKSNSDNKKSLT